jgi:diaminopimelate decarboxylase
MNTIDIIRRCFGSSTSELIISGVSAATIAEYYGTPLFVYDRQVVDRNLNALRSALPAEFEIYYSVKANPNVAILCHFVSRGCGLEIASSGEFLQAIAAGCAPDKIVYAGPGKTDDELELTLGNGIGEIHIESEHEARRIDAICKRRGFTAPVAVRVNPCADSQGGAMRMGGKAAPFGTDEEKVFPLVDYLVSNSNFDFSGIHLFVGTQILDYSILAIQYCKGVKLAREVASYIKRPLRTVDLGGGLGIPYFDGETELNLKQFGLEIERLIHDVRNERAFANTRFLIEPGRFLIGEAGIYVVRIVDIKESRGKKFLIVDGGMNHHLAASGNLGQIVKRNYPVVLLQKLDCPATDTVDVVGPLCTPLDTLGRGIRLPRAEIGDFLGILQSGAYTRTASPLGFLSHPTPAEVWVDSGQHFLIRSRGQADDAMRDVLLPPCLNPRSARPVEQLL